MKYLIALYPYIDTDKIHINKSELREKHGVKIIITKHIFTQKCNSDFNKFTQLISSEYNNTNTAIYLFIGLPTKINSENMHIDILPSDILSKLFDKCFFFNTKMNINNKMYFKWILHNIYNNDYSALCKDTIIDNPNHQQIFSLEFMTTKYNKYYNYYISKCGYTLIDHINDILLPDITKTKRE